MSINVKTENVTDATVQVHIAFENAGRYRRKSNRRRAARVYNRARLRTAEPGDLITGRNRAEHRSSTKAARPGSRKREPEILPPRLIRTLPKGPA